MRRALTPALLAAATLLEASARADEAAPAPSEVTYQIAGSAVRVLGPGEPRDVPVGCVVRALVRAADKLYAACGPAGVVRLGLADPLAPVVEGTLPVDGDAASVFLVRGRPWVEIARLEARPLDGATASTTQRPPPLARETPAASEPAEPTAERASRPAPPGRVAPLRVGGVWEVSSSVRAYLPMGDLGFGALGELEITHRFDLPIAIRAAMRPAGYAAGKQGGAGTLTGIGTLALDTRYFEIGLGFGAATLNDVTSASALERASVAVAQEVRIGAVDGLSFEGRSSIVVRAKSFEFGAFDARMQIPVADRWQLIATGGGGLAGYGYGDVGMRYRLTDTSQSGATWVVGGAGVAGIFTESCSLASSGSPSSTGSSTYYSCPDRSYVGPALRVGVAFRL